MYNLHFIYVLSIIQQNDLLFLFGYHLFEQQHKKFKHERLLDMEIIALQSELAKFILAEVLEKDGVFSIAQSVKYKDQYGLERLARLL